MKAAILILFIPLILLAQIPPLERSRAKNSYLLDDEFSDVKAAGAVNGTFAVPGPGLRTVTDTESKLTISGGNLVFSGGKAAPAYGDPGLWYAQLVRVTGNTMLAGIYVSDNGNNNFYFGYDENTSGGINYNSIWIGGSPTLILYYRDTSSPRIQTLAFNTTYKFGISLKSSGSYLFIKGGTFNEWTHLWLGSGGNASPIYPAMPVYNSVNNFNFLRIPTALLTVRPLAYSAFTGANGTALTQSDATSADGYGINPVSWGVSGWYITNNTATCLADGTNYINTVQSSGADVLCSVNMTNSTGNCGLTLRANDSNQTNCILVYYNGTAVKASVLTNSVEYNVATVVTAYSAGARLVTRIYDDHKLWVWYNEALVTGAPFDLSGYATLKTGTNHGLFNTSSANRLDSYNCYPKNDATVVSYLNKYSGDNP